MTIPQPTPELEVDHIECVDCGIRLHAFYVRVRDGLCRRCRRPPITRPIGSQ